VRGQPAG